MLIYNYVWIKLGKLGQVGCIDKWYLKIYKKYNKIYKYVKKLIIRKNQSMRQ